MNKKKEIAFLDSFTASTSIVPEVIDKLYQDLQTAGYPREEIDEIVLSMDESITNAVQVTMTCSTPGECAVRTRNITIRYTINENEFDATIIYTDKDNSYKPNEKYLYYVACTRSQHHLIIYNQEA